MRKALSAFAVLIIFLCFLVCLPQEAEAADYYLDLNGFIDNTSKANISGGGTCDIYINGSAVATGVSDYWTQWPTGTKWEIRNISAASGMTYNGGSNLSGTIGTSNVDARLFFVTTNASKLYYLDMNGVLDGSSSGNIANYGTASIYINGYRISTNVSDYYVKWPTGTTYEIKDITTASGKTLVATSGLSGTIGSTHSYAVLTYGTNRTVTVSHWTWGYQNEEGNNGSNKTAFALGNTSFGSATSATIALNATRARTIPKGFYLAERFGSSSFSGSWTTHAFGNYTMPNSNIEVEYDYYPTDYNITYELGGGENSASNPSTYNVLYGLTFAAPASPPTGYHFVEWQTPEGTRITGINVGANATFSSADDLYTKLSSRSIGDVSVIAKWAPNDYTVVFDPGYGTGSASANAQYDSDIALPVQGFNLPGYRLCGWNTDIDGNGTGYALDEVARNLTAENGGTATLYAQYEFIPAPPTDASTLGYDMFPIIGDSATTYITISALRLRKKRQRYS